MSSRLISGDRAVQAQRLVWPGPTPTGDNRPSDGKGTSGPEKDLSREVAEKQARIHELERELEARPRHAYEQGYSEGQAAGAQQAKARLDPVMAKLAQSIQELATIRKKHLVEAEEDAVRLAIAVARRVLRRELSVDPQSLIGIVKAAVERVDARDTHRLRLHPEDVAVLQQHLAPLALPPRVELIADTSLERGSVVVDTNRGSLDGSVSSQLLEIERGLVDLVRRNS